MGKIWRAYDSFVFEVSGEKRYLIARPGGFYLADYAPKGKAGNFSLFLRRRLNGRKIEQAEQLGLDRIVILRTADSQLILELFGKLNIILTDLSGTIIHALSERDWSKRSIRPGKTYVPPESFDFLSIGKQAFVELVTDKNKSELAKLLGIGRMIDDVWGVPEELWDHLNQIDVDPDLIEAKFKQLDLEKGRSEKSSKTKKLEKSIAKQKKTIEQYEERATELRNTAEQMFSRLVEFDDRLSNARKTKQKRLKITLPLV
ncbi:MAG: hypothetical protein GOU99_01000 [Candidatus Altiarchaeota archaeon]|nr:hypothetical protein [Candidatus Altiarchaeota archaeon]